MRTPIAAGILLAVASGCGGSGEDTSLPLAELADPQSCAECHPDHVREWSGSMHAYAAEDPVFRAMNARGQRETGGELGDFCVNCHAPVAVQLGLTTDGTNLDEVPAAYKGVTCFYCHQVDAIEGQHNNPLRLAWDTVMRGGISNPTPGAPHRAAYSALHDRDQHESADMCGSCHDIVNPNGVHIERTYLEWQESLYADDETFYKLTCAECHMRGRDGVAADFDGVPLRRVHDHSMAGVDVALTDWPERDAQLEAVQYELDKSLLAYLCVDASQDPNLVSVQLENVAAGHSFPSGASSDRRVWVELVAYDEAGEVGWSSGVVQPGEDVTKLADPNLWLFRDTHLDAEGNVVHMFWETEDYTSNVLPAPVAADPSDPDYVTTHVLKTFLFSGFEPSKIELRVRVMPVGYDVLDDLIASGDLDPAIRDAMPTFDLKSTVLAWTPEIPVNNGDLACVPPPPKL